MRYNRLWRVLLLPVFIFAVVLAAVVSYYAEENSCMGVRILSEAEMSRFTEYVPQEISGWILCNGEPAAADAGTFTVYISQNINETTEYNDLTGKLSIGNPAWEMYFAEDEMFSDLDTAVKENHKFRLVVATGAAEYMEYGVVFTTLPVIRLSGAELYTAPDGEKVYGSSMAIWDSNYAGTGGYILEKSNAEWSDNDQRDISEPKHSWKLSLKSADGNVYMLNLFGLGKDDDWVLNSAYGDDSKVREKLAAKLWNDVAVDGQHMLKTPEGEYAEVVCNGEYHGIYVISRKTDQKYLNLDSYDILIRDKKFSRGSYIQNNYSIVEGYYTEEEVWNIVNPVYSKEDLSAVDLNSWIDANLVVNMLYNQGKRNYTEMYYLWESAAIKPSVEYMPITEDGLLGVTCKDKEFVFDGALSTLQIKYRQEYQTLKSMYPELDDKIAERYRYLRENIFKEDTIFEFIDREYSSIKSSGAVARDAQRWSESENETAAEDLKKYIEARFEYLDSVYKFS